MCATDYLTLNSKFSFTLLEVITNFTKIFPTWPVLIYLSFTSKYLVSTLEIISSFSPQYICTFALLITSVYLKIFILSPRDYPRFCPQNIPSLSTSDQLIFPSKSPFSTNTEYLKLLPNYSLHATSDYIILPSKYSFSPPESTSSFSPINFPSLLIT